MNPPGYVSQTPWAPWTPLGESLLYALNKGCSQSHHKIWTSQGLAKIKS